MFKSKVGFVFPMTGPPKGLSETPEEMAEDDLILERTVFPTLGDI